VKPFGMQDFEMLFARLMFTMDTGARRRLWLKLAKLIGHGVQMLNAIADMRNRRIAAGGKSHPETIALGEWSKTLNNGRHLSESLAGWVPPDERMLISAGEQSGNMAGALVSVARVLEARKEINAAVVKGLAYPFFLLVMSFGVLYLFGFKIVPAFTTGALKNAHWTGMALGMINVSLFIREWLWLIAVLFFGGIGTFFATLSVFDGRLRVKLDRYAPYSIYRIIQGSSWLIAMAALVEAGMRIENALNEMAENARPWLRARLSACAVEMSSGRNLGDALHRTGYEFPDREIIDDLAVYSGLGGFDEALAILGKEWLEESVAQIQSRMAVAFGACILLLGTLIAFMVRGMLAMQLQLSTALQTSFR
jgi:type II secretory pathway component PulF